jgi:transposase InsO family protein
MKTMDEEQGRAELRPEEGVKRPRYSAAQRLILLDLALKSGLPLREYADVVGLSYTTLSDWKRKFEEQGPDGLMDRPVRYRDAESRLPEVTKRAILLIRQAHPEYGSDRISDMLGRGPGLGASPNAVLRVIREAGLEVETPPVPVHRDTARSFERARPNQMWQTDIFTFTLKRQNRRLYLVAFLDDHSRYVVGYGLHASMGGALVVEVLKAAIGAYGAPEEILSDNGPQYHTWRGKGRFTKELERLGIRHILARPRHPQTVGKTERFWGTLWRECLSAAVFLDVEDARRRVGHFIDHYNFQRPHQGIEGLVPADRFFGAKDEVGRMLAVRVAANALALAKDGAPRKPFYLTGRVGDVDLSIHAEGQRVVLNTADGRREEVDLRASGRRAETPGYEPVPEPVAVHDAVDVETEEADDEGWSEESGGWEDEGPAVGERGGEAGRGDDPGGDERGAWPAGGVGGAGNLVDALLRAGGPGAAGDGAGAGAASAGASGDLAGGCPGEAGEGAGPAAPGAGACAGAAEAGAQEREAGAAGGGEGEETPPEDVGAGREAGGAVEGAAAGSR